MSTTGDAFCLKELILRLNIQTFLLYFKENAQVSL